jgi:hypothetical protein
VVSARVDLRGPGQNEAMSGRHQGRTIRGWLSVFPLFVLVLLGILLMHGGLSAHVDRQGHDPVGAQIGASMPAGAMRPAATPLRMAGLGPGDRLPTAVHARNSPDCGNGHAGEMCLAFLRLAGFLAAVLLIGWAVRSGRHGRSLPQTASFRSGRSPPSGPPRSHAPSLASLCVLRL